MPAEPHHTRPESLLSRFEFSHYNIAEAIGGVLHLANRWLADNPDAASRFGAAVGSAVGAYLAARDYHRGDGGTADPNPARQ